MSAYQSESTLQSGVPEIPTIARDFLQLPQKDSLEQALAQLEQQYPQFFSQLLNIINSDHFNLTAKAHSIYQVISLSGFERVCCLMLVQVVYKTLNQYKITGVDMQAFWQDNLRRAVSARMLGELIGLDANCCFTAGFMQDIGFLLLFLEQPEKAPLWDEFRKREPEARLSMEQNVFSQRHDVKLREFLEHWGILGELRQQVFSHHQCDEPDFSELDNQLCRVLHCADWLSAVYTADDKSHVINRCRKILTEDFQVERYRTEAILEAIPDEVDLTALVLDIKVSEHIVFSQILYEANVRLNEDNVNFQELTLRLEQALDERDQLAAEINRELSLAREIQQSLLPPCFGDDYPVNGINISAKILSGDFYDYFEVDNGDVYFNLGDVSGKGVNAALLMAKTCSLFRCLGKRIYEPGRLLYEINNELCETSVHGMFVTMVAGLYQPKTGKVTLVNAGNPPALLFSEDGLCREFAATAPPLGVLPNIEYEEYSIDLKNGSLYIYSDGVTEGYVNENEMFELSGLFKMIATMPEGMQATERLKKIVGQFTDNAEPLRDDVTLLLLEKPQQ